ncbi:MAG: hypothetical protein R2879_08345 [Saprospiraceae bacterium]
MISELLTIHDVYSQHSGQYFLFNNIFICQRKSSNEILFFDIFKKAIIKRERFNVRIENFKLYENQLFFNDHHSKLYKIDNLDILTLELNNKVYLRPNENSEFSLSRVIDDSGNKKYFAFNLRTKKFQFELEKNIRFISKDWFFKYEDNQIIALKSIKNQVVQCWEFDLNDLPKFYKNVDRQYKGDRIERWLGVFKNNIFVVLESGRIIGINLLTGKEEVNIFSPKSLGKMYSNDKLEIQFSPYSLANFDPINNTFIGIFGNQIFEFSISNGLSNKEYDLKDNLQEFQPFIFDYNNIGDLPFNDDFIIGIDKMNGKFIVWNRKSKAIIGKKDLDIKNPNGNVLILNSTLSQNHICLGLPNETVKLYSIGI